LFRGAFAVTVAELPRDCALDGRSPEEESIFPHLQTSSVKADALGHIAAPGPNAAKLEAHASAMIN
jgi:hypothetical protein